MGKKKKTKEHIAKIAVTQTGINTQNNGYVVITPKGDVIEAPCMRAFCKSWAEEKLTPQLMSSVAVGKYKNHKGYQCFYKENYNE